MTSTLSRAVRRASAVLLLGALLFVVVACVVMPVVGAFERSREEVERLETQLGRLAGVARTLDAAVAERASLAQRNDASDLHFKEASLEIAAGRLQQAIGELVRANGGEMRMARVLEGGKADAKAVVAFSFAISHAGLVPLLHAIEFMRPVTFVDSVAVRLNRSLDGERSTGGTAGPAGPFRNEPILDVGLEASAWLALGKAR